MKILFCTSNKIGARGIRLVTWSSFSHVCIIDGQDVIEAVWPKVKVTPLGEVLNNHIHHAIVDIPSNDESVLVAARSQIGKKYDLTGMLGLSLHRDWQDDSAWWCSELVAWALQQGGTKLFRDEVMHRVTPQDLWKLNYKLVERG